MLALWGSGAFLAVLAGLVVVACGPSSATPGGPATAITGAASAPASSTVAGSSPPPCASAAPASDKPAPSGFGRRWWSNRVFYEAFVRSFADSNDDGIGDLAGLTARLDALNDGDPNTIDDLGVTGLWLMPVMESPSYHGYDVTDYRSIERDYGTVAAFRTLVDAAHRRGIAVIVDLPLNHTSSDHAWFTDSRRPGSAHTDWYVWASQPPGGPGWHQDGDRWFYGIFSAELPDLNLRDPAVTEELISTARFWLDDLNVDGFRLDAAKHLVEEGLVVENAPSNHAWLREFNSAVHRTTPAALLVGEVWDLSAVSASYVPRDLDMTFEFGLATAYVDAVRGGLATPLADALRDVARLETSDGFGAFLTNHDQDRVATQLDSDPAALQLAASLLLTGPGVPFVYYGEEIGMTGAKPDERIRTPMQWDASEPAAGFSAVAPWQPLSEDWRSVNVAAERGDPGSLLTTYRELVRFRAAHPALSSGSIVPVTSAADGVVATLRASAGETLLVVANVSTAPVTDYSLDLETGPLCGAPIGATLRGPAGAASPTVTPGGGFSGYRPLTTLPARSVVVIQLAP